jgi:16S rRNA (guanine966-N2)-methyltransferase
MRIIGGKNKGKKINIPIDKNTRPLRDMVKESIFNLIEHTKKFNITISNSNILDLFSGTGSFGLECFSRGAQNITFVEEYEGILKILKKNISSIGANESCQIIEKNCFDYFESENKFHNKFDIIFLDPPYKEEKIDLLIEKVKKNKILTDSGVIIVHRHKKDDVNIEDKLNILESRNYGISKILFGN